MRGELLLVFSAAAHISVPQPVSPPPAAPHLLDKPEKVPVGGPHWRSLCGVQGACSTSSLGHLGKGETGQAQRLGIPARTPAGPTMSLSSLGPALLAHLAGVVRGAEGAVLAGALRVPDSLAGAQLHLICGREERQVYPSPSAPRSSTRFLR